MSMIQSQKRRTYAVRSKQTHTVSDFVGDAYLVISDAGGYGTVVPAGKSHFAVESPLSKISPNLAKL